MSRENTANWFCGKYCKAFLLIDVFWHRLHPVQNNISGNIASTIFCFTYGYWQEKGRF